MVLGTLTFASNPSKMTVLVKDKFAAEVITHSSVAFFDWGRVWAGKPVTMNWDYMTATDFDLLDALQDVAGDQTFDPQDGKGKTYQVWVKKVNGVEYHLDLSSSTGVYRKDVELILIIKAQN
jgi:hypothetical protein